MDFLYQLVAIITIVYIAVTWVLRKFRVGNYGDKYVFITGCDSGFGNLLTKRLDTLGFHVFSGCLTEMGIKDLKETCSKNVIPVEIDVTREGSIAKAKRFVEKNLPKHKGLWAVVNNAGIAGAVSPNEWLTRQDFEQTIAINLYGVIFVTKAFLPLVRKEVGRVVNISSITARFAAATGPYVAAKYGVEGFSDTLRRELYTTGVRVHLIEPGYFSTGIVDENTIGAGLKSRYEQASDEVRQYYGPSFRDKLLENSCAFLSLVLSPKIHKVIDAYEHSITARFPKIRYVVGWDANIFFRLLWNLPEWLSDLIVCYFYPTPEFITKKK